MDEELDLDLDTTAASSTIIELNPLPIWLGEIGYHRCERDSPRIRPILDHIRMSGLAKLPSPPAQRKAIGKRLTRLVRRAKFSGPHSDPLLLVLACYNAMMYGAEPKDVIAALNGSDGES